MAHLKQQKYLPSYLEKEKRLMKILNRIAVLGLTGALVAACTTMDGDAAKTEAAKPEMKAAAAKSAEKKKAKPDQAFVIYFDFGKSTINDEGMNAAYQLMANTMGGYKAILLTGHTDTAGDKAFNRKLSEKRVEETKQVLSEIGIDPAKVVTQFYGEDEPAEKTGDGVKNAKNRRVEIVLKF
jgi:outer membrane protein OmpA-like peptidoglycan-associated protein